MKTLIAVVNWLVVLVLTAGGIVFLSAALRKEFWKSKSESITYGSIGIVCLIFAILLAVSILIG